MGPEEIRAQRLAAIGILGCLLFNYPILALFNRPGFVFGIPLVYAYVFAAWCLLIALLAAIASRRAR
jgi:hypothetical protein